ncbi:hypothetical protein LRS10_09335 [Phenylobacterium sp. J426]|uniref:hypothetical protein n=1 Tax=Phenylobacterium sp. J426 TaxID=2898439 RepID=UPI002151D28A|nr:hypothetical protein [Phenylobacterium sp. J426]MCR5874345.1 hypothetical protein [Phenylobacterium sp. J426]
MAAQGARVIRICSERSCGQGSPVDVVAILEAEGPRATLWNRRPACPHCGERGHYMASPGAATPFRPLLSDELWQEAKRQLLKSLSLSKLDVKRIQSFAERVTSHLPDARGLSDLDAGIFVTARIASTEEVPKALRYMGEWAGRDLLYRELNAGERSVWRRRRSGPRPV